MNRATSPALKTWKGVVVRGQAAMRLLESHGWRVVSHEGELQVAAEFLRSDGFLIARIWQSAATLQFVGGGEGAEKPFIALVGAQGLVTIDGGEAQDAAIRTDDVYVRALAGAPLTVVADEPAAYLVMTSAWDSLGLRQSHPSRLPKVLRADEGFVRTFVASAHTVLQEVSSEALAFHWLKRSLEALLGAVIASADPMQIWSRTSPERTIFISAMQLIQATASSADTTVSSVARKLGISTSRLHHAFATEGRTPARELRSTRVASARAVLGPEGRASSSVSLDQAARIAGFSTVRAMKRALDESS